MLKASNNELDGTRSLRYPVTLSHARARGPSVSLRRGHGSHMLPDVQDSRRVLRRLRIQWKRGTCFATHRGSAEIEHTPCNWLDFPCVRIQVARQIQAWVWLHRDSRIPWDCLRNKHQLWQRDTYIFGACCFCMLAAGFNGDLAGLYLWIYNVGRGR